MAGVTNVAFRTLCRELEQGRGGTVSALSVFDPATTYAAVKKIADDGLADHVDMNFGCPVPKVTRRGGGAALPYKRQLFGQIVNAAVRGTAGTDIPVTVKYRIGSDDDHP